MSVRIVFWMSSFFLLHMLVGCPGAPVTPPLIGTTLPGNELVFKGVDVGQDKVQTFTLFSDSVTPLRVDKIELQQGSDSVFSIVDNGGFPDILESGPKQGRTIKIRFVPTKDRAFSASLLVYAPGADNADPQGIFTIKIRSTPSRLQLLWSCAGSLRFGKIDVGKERTLSCLLTNPGEKTVALKSATYQKSLGRDSSFEWVLPTFPVTLAPQGELQIRIRYRPSEDFLGAEQGVFSLASNLNSQEAKKVLKLKVYGESSASRVLLVEPQSGTCTTQESCSFDKRLQCSTLKDQTSACVPKEGVTPFLLFEPVAAGSSSQRRVVLRAMGSSPLTVKKIQITEGNGSFSLDKQIPLPRLLQPGDTIELNLSYVGKAGKTPKGNLRIQSDSLLMPSQNIALEASPPSCSLRVTPQTLRFSVANEVQSFDIRNVGMADCVLSSFMQSSESPEYFKVLKTPGAALKVGEKVSVQVKYTPPIELEYRGSILIRSNDPVNPEARVSLIGAATKPKDCDLQVSTKSVSFGFVDVGMSTFQKITISNRGIGTCTFQNFEVRESSGALPKAFSIFEPKGFTNFIPRGGLNPFGILMSRP